MITSTDIRVRFKMDTGKYPVHFDKRPHPRKGLNYPLFDTKGNPVWNQSKDKGLSQTFHGNIPKSVYGAWLEEQLGNPRLLREKFYQETKIHPIHPDHKRNMFEGFKIPYSLWLEEKLVELYNLFGMKTI